jgi:beta-lactamase class A
MMKFLAVIALTAVTMAGATVSAQEDTALTAKLQALTAGYHGHVAVYARELASGKTVSLDADEPVQTASVIKLTILYEALEQIRAGQAHFDDKITLTHADQVPGSGILLFFDTPQTITLKDALTFMIIMSDNTATNLVIDHLGLKNIDDRIVSLGLKNTWLYKKVFRPADAADGPMPADQKQFGLGKTTAREMASVMQRFVTCDLGTPHQPQDDALCAAAMHMLKNQFYRNSIPRYLENLDTTVGESAIANKTGALDEVRNDVGVVFTKQHGSIVISEFTWDNEDHSWTPDNAGEVLMAKLAKAIVDDWNGAPGQ